jgi:ribonuclease HII
MKPKFIVGIDEAGRGALAGPVAVGGVLVPNDFDWDIIPGVGDSKALSPVRRDAIFERARQLEKEGMLVYAVALVSEKIIDRKGITFAIRSGIERCIDELEPNPDDTFVKLDGLLKAPALYIQQQTIVKGDATEKEIGLASIMAKVTRDRRMVLLAWKYPEYGFEVHKGYGTLAHRKSILTNGLSGIHRTTFCKTCQ